VTSFLCPVHLHEDGEADVEHHLFLPGVGPAVLLWSSSTPTAPGWQIGPNRKVLCWPNCGIHSIRENKTKPNRMADRQWLIIQHLIPATKPGAHPLAANLPLVKGIYIHSFTALK